jgi:hypothetical protein
MPRWNTAKILDDLKKIPGVVSVTNRGPGGDCDSDNLEIKVSGTTDQLFVCAFTTDYRADQREGADDDFPMVEVSDGKDSRGGLNSANEALGIVYVKVRIYFLKKKFDVVPSLSAYF